MTQILAVDLGGSGLRAGLLDADGALRRRHHLPLTHRVDADGAAEIDPVDWWRALEQAVAALEPGPVAAVAVVGMTRTQVLVDADGEPIAPAILFHDRRSAATVADLRLRCPKDHPETAALDAFHPLARLWWLARERPAAMARATAVLDPKDFLNLRLTGRTASDPVSLSRLIVAGDLTAAAGLPSLLPPLVDPRTILGTVRAGLPGALAGLAGAPVVTMATDSWAAAIGLGALRDGGAYSLSGTTEVTGVITARPAQAPGLLSLDWSAGLHHLGGPSQAGADCLAWLAETLGLAGPIGQATTTLLAGPRASEPVLFLPHLTGARAPYWDPDRRGAFIGLARGHGPTDLAWSVLEGVACLTREVISRAEAATGRPIAELRFGGGGAASPAWAQIKADMLDRPVAVVESDEPGLAGAGIVALTALGRYPDLGAGQAALVRVARRHAPDPRRHRELSVIHDLFRAADAALAPISAELGRAWR